MKKLLLLLPFCFMLCACFSDDKDELNALYNDHNSEMEKQLDGVEHIEFAYKQQRGGMQVTSLGRIVKILDNQSTPYAAQQILIRLNSGRKLIIKHNIEIAKPVVDLKVGEVLQFSGIYKWNHKGGMILSTHYEAANPKRSGWLMYRDIVYQ